MQMTGETPPNINEPYAKHLITIICSFIAFLTVRHVCMYYNKAFLASSYRRIETVVINFFSFQCFSTVCPPLGAYFVAILMIASILPLLILNNNLAVNSNRAGFLVLSLVPFLLSSTGKNSALSLLTGISSAKLNLWHRMLGYAIFILATVHMATMIYSWAKFPTFLATQLALPKVRYGLGAYGCLCVVTLFSALPVRVLSYELFLVTHLFGFGFIGVIAIHTPYAMRYFITGLICYSLNLVAVWFVKSYIAKARFHILPEGCTKVSIRLASPIQTHTIGQHIYLCVPAISPFEWHPFTITSVQQRTTTIEVCVCVRGNFTRKLYNRMKEDEDVTVFVSGPFGSRSIDPKRVLSKFPSVVIACGGAGVTFGIRMLRELTETLMMQDDVNVKAQHVYFSWCVCRPGELEWFRDELERLHYLYYAHKGFPQLHIQFHNSSQCELVAEQDNTEAISETVSEDQQEDTKGLFDGEEKKYPRKFIETVHGQRVDIPSLLSVDTHIGAYVCGPSSFNAAFKRNVALHHLSTVQLHCEDFGY